MRKKLQIARDKVNKVVFDAPLLFGAAGMTKVSCAMFLKLGLANKIYLLSQIEKLFAISSEILRNWNPFAKKNRKISVKFGLTEFRCKFGVNDICICGQAFVEATWDVQTIFSNFYIPVGVVKIFECSKLGDI